MHGAQPANTIALRQRSLIRAALALVVMGCGLCLRWYGFPLGLPAFAVKYGGSLLWATMVFLLVGVLLPRRSLAQIAAIAMGIAVVVEFSRLVHTPWLDAFRLTTAGALLLGLIFSLWNLVACAVGIAFGVWIDRLAGKRGLVGWAKARQRRAHHFSSLTTMVGTLRFAHPTRPAPWRAAFTPPIETAQSDRVLPRSRASAPCALRSSYPPRPRSISASAASLPAGRS